MTDVTPEKVLTQVQEGMKAFESFKSEFAKYDLSKLDAIDSAKLEKMADDISKAVESSQAREGEIKAANEQIARLEAAIERAPSNGEDSKEVEAKCTEAFNHFLKKGAKSDRHDFADYAEQKGLDLKALSVNSDPDGGFLVMPTFGGVIDVRVFESSPVRQYANIETISTDALELVLDNDEPAASWVGEEGTRSETSTPTLDKKYIPTHELFAEPRATQKLLDDSAVNMEQWLAGKVAAKFARAEATAFISGNGVTQPTGILTNTATGTSYDAVNVQVVNSGSSGAYTYNGLVDLQNSLKEVYQSNAIWMTKRANFGALMKIKSGITDDNTPIFNMTYATNTGLAGFQMLTRPVVFADDVPAVANDANALIYGDFASGYTIVDRVGIRVIRDPYTAKPFVKFYTTKRVGGDVVNAEALKIQALST